jgi:hypothetical protein
MRDAIPSGADPIWQDLELDLAPGDWQAQGGAQSG